MYATVMLTESYEAIWYYVDSLTALEYAQDLRTQRDSLNSPISIWEGLVA